MFTVSPFCSSEHEDTFVPLPFCLLSSEISKMRTCEQWDNPHLSMRVLSMRIFNFQTSTTGRNILYLLWLVVLRYLVIAMISVAKGSMLRVKWFDSIFPGSGSHRHKRYSLSLRGFQTQISEEKEKTEGREEGEKDLSWNCFLLQTRKLNRGALKGSTWQALPTVAWRETATEGMPPNTYLIDGP